MNKTSWKMLQTLFYYFLFPGAEEIPLALADGQTRKTATSPFCRQPPVDSQRQGGDRQN